jgi:hypothetical protein
MNDRHPDRPGARNDHLVLVTAIGIDGEGGKHPMAPMEGATENAPPPFRRFSRSVFRRGDGLT